MVSSFDTGVVLEFGEMSQIVLLILTNIPTSGNSIVEMFVIVVGLSFHDAHEDKFG